MLRLDSEKEIAGKGTNPLVFVTPEKPREIGEAEKKKKDEPKAAEVTTTKDKDTGETKVEIPKHYSIELSAKWNGG